MSSTGIRRIRDTNSRLSDSILDADRLQIESEKVFKTAGDINDNAPGISNVTSAAGHYLSKTGDLRDGIYGNNFTIAEIIDDSFGLSIAGNIYKPVIIMNGEGGAPDDLVSVDLGDTTTLLHAEIMIQAGAFAITIKEDLGEPNHILTPGSANVVLNPGDMAKLVYSALAIAWILVWNSPNAGGGGVSFPIDFPEDDRGTVGASTQDILFTDSDRHSVKMIVSGDVDLSFSSPPSNETAYTNIIIVQDVTGGHTVTVPTGTINKAIVDAGILTGPDEETGIVIKYAFGVFYAFLETGNIVSGGGGTNNLSDLIINIASKDWLAQGISNFGPLTGVTAVQYVDTGSVVRGSMSGDAGATAVRLSLSAGNKFIISDVLTDIVSFDNTTGIKLEGSHVINMNNNIINQISELQFSNSNAHTPSNELSIAFDSTDDELKYSVALTTDAHSWYADTDRLASIVRTGTDQGQLNIHDVISDILQANNQLILVNSSLDPGFNGEFRTNGVDVKVFSGGAVRNLSNVGASPSSIVDGNSSATILDAAPSFVVVLDGVQKYSISNTRVDYEDLDLFGINQINMTDPSSNDISSLTASASGLLLNILSTSDVYDIKFNSADAFHVEDIRTRILSTTPNTTPPVFSLFRDDSSPTIGDELGIIKFEGNNSASAFTTYGEISTTIENSTAGAEYANFFVNLKQNGLDVDMLRIVNGVMILRTFNPVANEGALFNLLKEDASPGNGDLIGAVNWNVLDSPTELTYARIQVFIQNATDAALFKIQMRSDGTLQDAFIIEANDSSSQFQYLTSGNGNTRMQPLGSARMGYFVTPQVTDFSLNIGTSGSLEIPRINNGSPSLNDLNAAGGAFNTSLFVHDISDGSLYAKNSNTQWDVYARTGTIV